MPQIVNCEGCMALKVAFGRITEECKRLIRAKLCQKQVAMQFALEQQQPIEGEIVEG